MSEKSLTVTDRLIGALGGAGGALLFTVLFEYLLNPSWLESIWLMDLAFGIIGASLVAMAVFLDLKSRNKFSKP